MDATQKIIERLRGLDETLGYEIDEEEHDVAAITAAIVLIKRLKSHEIVMDENYVEDRAEDGFWHSCSGCHSTNQGASTGTYPHHSFFKCELGGGCAECGYLGALWDDIDYSSLHLAEKD